MSPILFLSCNKSKNLYALEKEVVEWAGIDEVVKEAFIFNSRNEILDLDANEIIKIKDSSIVGIYKRKKIFYIRRCSL